MRRFLNLAVVVSVLVAFLAPLDLLAGEVLDQKALRRAKMRENRAAVQAQRAEHKKARAIQKDAKAYKKLKMPAEALQANIEKLTHQLDWQDSLEEARRIAKRDGKSVLWIHALGELSGYL